MLEDGDGASGAMSAGSTEGPAPRPRDDKAAAQCASRRSARHGTLILVALGALVLASTLASLMLGRYPHHPDRGCRHAGQPGAPHRLVLDLPARDAVLPGASAAHRARAHGGLQPGYCRRRLPGHVPEPARLPRYPRSFAGRGVRRRSGHPAGTRLARHLAVRVRLLHRRRAAGAGRRHARQGQPSAHRGAGRRHGQLAVPGGRVVHQAHRRPYRPAGRHHLLAHGAV